MRRCADKPAHAPGVCVELRADRAPAHHRHMNYSDTLILVATDCKAGTAIVPPSRAGAKTVAELQYEMMSSAPYRHTQEDILFEVHLRRADLSDADRKRRRDELREAFFQKPQACLRASPLPKTYGWGIHFDGEGRAALVARESAQYARMADGGRGGPKLLAAMRSKRAG